MYFEQTKVFAYHKLTCTNRAMYWLSAKLGSKKEIETCKYIKYDVSALTWDKICNTIYIPWGVNFLIYSLI